jgi:undecaprenyl pyrophosphate synthase
VDLGIPYLTVYALSLDNLYKREKRELDLLFELFIQAGSDRAMEPSPRQPHLFCHILVSLLFPLET